MRWLLAIVAMFSLVAVARAASPGPRDPDWPCQQIKVAQLSLAAIWSGPALDTQPDDWRQDLQLAELVQVMTQRRVPLEQAEERIRAFAVQAGEQKRQKLLQALNAAFSVLDADRSSVIAGLDRFGARQKELAAVLREDNEKLRVMQADPALKPADINDMVQRVTWEAEVFQDRRQAISYACDVPAKIEQRLFALARTIQDALNE
jgi:hypothetical protein